jgi:ubiquinone/menaquinone biosynthesis C-methylase UbiE
MSLREVFPMAKNKKDLTKEHFGEAAKDFDQKLGTFASTMYAPLLSMARRQKAKQVLDIGCGTGTVLKLLWEERPNAMYYGIDISPEMIDEAARKLKKGIDAEQILLMEGDAEKLPFKKRSMDLVICNASFHHYPNPGRALVQMHKVLRNGGRLILGDPCPSKLTAPLKNRFKHKSEVHIYTKAEFKKILKIAGFKIEKFVRPSRGRCVILAKKVDTGKLSKINGLLKSL